MKMDIFQRYDILLERLSLDKIELVRNWRNDPKISQYMDFKEYISPEMQLNWFNKINNDNNYYFIAVFKSENIGLVNIKDIDYINKCGEPGIFVYKDKYLNSDVGFRMALCNMDFAFEFLKLEYLYGHIMANNKRAIRYNKAFGYLLDVNQDNYEKQRYKLTKERYFEQKSKIIKLFH
jgi:UDP-4-amino-4,6-dideoxy-N-acetyl-beta-L-altrosamine N-acetyltransferase